MEHIARLSLTANFLLSFGCLKKFHLLDEISPFALTKETKKIVSHDNKTIA